MIADETIIYTSPDPENIYCYTPWITHGFNERLILSFDIAGPGIDSISGAKSDHGDYGSNQCLIYVSDDNGKNWHSTSTLPMLHARVFKAGKYLYIIGHSGRLLISKSADNGNSWTTPSILDSECRWHQSGCSMDFYNNRVYLTMEHEPYPEGKWAGGDPFLMAANAENDLTIVGNWTFSNKCSFVKNAKPISDAAGIGATCWLESNVVRQHNKMNELYDPSGKSLLVFLRVAGSHFNNYAAVLSATESNDGALYLQPIKLKDNKNFMFLPFPGGYMKFHIIYDDIQELYWMVCSQAAYSSLIMEKYKPDNFMNERRRLELFYSSNLFDWCSGGIIAAGSTESEARHYASATISGSDLLVLSRSGDQHAKDSHDTNLITLHRVKSFRDIPLL